MPSKCPLCRRELVPYGTGGFTCPLGHQFLASEFGEPVTVGGRSVVVRAWVPGAVLGGLGLVVSVVGLVI